MENKSPQLLVGMDNNVDLDPQEDTDPEPLV